MTDIKMGKKRKMGDITKKIYATCTSPIMHLICPPKILHKHAFFSVSLGTAVIPRRNKKQRVMQNRGGGGANKVHCGRCASATTKQKTLKRNENGVKHN